MNWGHRYTYVQKLLVYLAVVVVVFQGMSRPKLIAGCVLAHALCLAVIDTRGFHFYRTDRRKGERVMRFVEAAAIWRADSASSGTAMVHIDRSELVVQKAKISASPPR